MIKIKIDDTIIDIVEKIEAQESGDIILDFPLGHPILHNYISLKILKSKVGTQKLIIATNDRIGKKIGKRLGIEYSVIKDSNFIETSKKGALMQHNFTFWEYFKFQIHSYIQELRSGIDTNKKLNSLTRYSRIYQDKNSLLFFIMALLGSICLFIFVYYFAVSRTYIYISPEIIVKKEAHNFVFKENIKNSILGDNKYIKINTLSKNINTSEVYSSTEIQVDTQNISKGKVILYNRYLEELTLVPNTRLQDPQGIIFETLSWVKVPAGVKDNFGKIAPGSVEVDIQAKVQDLNGGFTGSKGNIKTNTELFLPGLSEDARKEIYAVTLEDFQGGKDSYTKIVSQDDIDKAYSLFEQKLKNEALKSIKNSISSENKRNNTQIDILSGGKSIRYSEININIEDNIKAGDIRDNFKLSGDVTIYAYTYNKESIIQKLKTLINERKLEGVEKISHIDMSSLRMSEILYANESPFEMKATFEIEVLFLHDFLHQDNTYVTQLSSKIRGLDKQEAEKILLNDPKVSNVEIEIRPFFSTNISNIYQNIIFKVR